MHEVASVFSSAERWEGDRFEHEKNVYMEKLCGGRLLASPNPFSPFNASEPQMSY